MPEFSPSSAHTAIAPVVVKPSGLSCEAEVFLGPDEATKVVTSGLVVFTSTGASQDISLPVTMPSAEGTYHVFIDVYAEGILIAAYTAIEDVVIVSVPVAVYRCVYCPATFSTEAGLVGHMESSHPGKPYLVYAYPEVSQVASGGSFSIVYKIYTPTVPQPPGGYEYFWHGFMFYTLEYEPWVPFAGAYVSFEHGTPAGFYTGRAGFRAEYMISRRFYYMPPGVYSLYSQGFSSKHDEEYESVLVQQFWKDVDTGQTITVI